MEKLSAAFFDMGETLYTYHDLPLSWKPHYKKAWKQALLHINTVPTEDNLTKLAKHMVKFNTREVAREKEYDAEYIFKGALKTIGVELDLYKEVSTSYFDYFRQTLTPYKETISVLRALKKRNIFIGALTDVAYGMPDSFVADDLRQVGIFDYIDSWKTSVHVGVRKPNPKGLLLLCDEAGCKPQKAMYVGNERKDIDAAKAAGLVAILVYRSEKEPPLWSQDFTIKSLTECERFFRN